jgi:hypothetical protein
MISFTKFCYTQVHFSIVPLLPQFNQIRNEQALIKLHFYPQKCRICHISGCILSWYRFSWLSCPGREWPYNDELVWPILPQVITSTNRQTLFRLLKVQNSFQAHQWLQSKYKAISNQTCSYNRYYQIRIF